MVQNKLDELYTRVLDKEELQSIFPPNILGKISAPHLLNINQNYLQADTRILFVGKETNKWWGKLEHFLEVENAIDILKDRYRVKFFGGEVPKSNNINELKSYKAEKYSTPFFTEYKKVSKALCNGMPGALVWSNLLKMDLERGKKYSRNSKSNTQIVSISKKIFLEELEILKPDYIIFATSYTYDDIIKEFLGELISESEVIEKRSLWKFKVGDTTCFRTWHPSTIRYKAKKSKFEYYQDIIDYISNESEI
ncbi:hypothetical protein [Sulfurovum sp. AR]|uniref:hypothetical protein n=1 Tax=Sulfurovum sp. AR TaxID=1165841 RepID=UPI00025C4CC0|nr:hypothetical protein [Sulfurovum sp. AR]EIF51368.1 hypothetical protein SULAR_03952 [Sulfurovum sp. AR]